MRMMPSSQPDNCIYQKGVMLTKDEAGRLDQFCVLFNEAGPTMPGLSDVEMHELSIGMQAGSKCWQKQLQLRYHRHSRR